MLGVYILIICWILWHSEKLEEVRAQERQLAEIEKQEILEFESRLAAASSKQVSFETIFGARRFGDIMGFLK